MEALATPEERVAKVRALMADPALWPETPSISLATIRAAILELCELFADLIEVEDEEDAQAGREVLAEMERTGEKPIPYEQVRRFWAPLPPKGPPKGPPPPPPPKGRVR